VPPDVRHRDCSRQGLLRANGKRLAIFAVNTTVLANGQPGQRYRKKGLELRVVSALMR
jgi:hypothetical protein